MKKNLLKLSLFLTVGGIIYFTNVEKTNAHSNGKSISGYSGSPYDGATCGTNGGCHNSHPLQSEENWVTSNVPVSGYVPGTTYTITCKPVNKTSGQNTNFGFEITPQNQSTGAVVGTLANITTSGAGSTQITSSEWVTHTSSSYQATDSTSWSFKWTAPNPGVGAVNFYAVFNCGESDNESSAYIYWDSLHYVQAKTTGVEQITDVASEINVYPNPVKDVININYSLQESKQVEVNLYSIDGKQVGTLLSGAEQAAGEHTYALQVPSVTPGLYLLQVVQGEQVSYKKVVVER
ncbi:MAG: choice-of-anchor V domain-containing protein [Bacteroidia bacterium]